MYIQCVEIMHSKSSHHKKHKKDKKKHKHKSRHSDEGSRHHHKKTKRKHSEIADGSAASDIIYIDDGAHSVKQLRLDDDNSLQVTCVTVAYAGFSKEWVDWRGDVPWIMACERLSGNDLVVKCWLAFWSEGIIKEDWRFWGEGNAQNWWTFLTFDLTGHYCRSRIGLDFFLMPE